MPSDISQEEEQFVQKRRLVVFLRVVAASVKKCCFVGNCWLSNY